MSTSSESWSLPGRATPRTAAVAAVGGGRGLRRRLGRAAHRLLPAQPDRRHADLPAVRRRDRERPGAVPRLPARVPAGGAARLRGPVAPALAGRRPVRLPHGFEAEMLVCGALALLFMLSVLLSARGRAAADRGGARLRRAGAARCSARSMLSRFDLWPAALIDGRAGRVRRRTATRSARACSGSRSRRSSFRRCSLRSRRSGSGGGAAGARLLVCARRVRRRARALLPSVPRALAARGLAQHDDPDEPTAPDRVVSAPAVLLVAHVVGGLGITMRSSHGSQNLAGTGPDALAAVQTVAAGGGARRHLDLVRTRAGDARAARPRVGRGGLRVRRVRKGALAPVPDLAGPARPARARPARARRERAARARRSS